MVGWGRANGHGCCPLHEVLIITTCVFAGGWVLLVIIRARLSCGSRSHQGHGRDQGKDPFSPTHPTLRLISLGVWHASSDLPVIAAGAPTGSAPRSAQPVDISLRPKGMCHPHLGLPRGGRTHRCARWVIHATRRWIGPAGVGSVPFGIDPLNDLLTGVWAS